MTPQNDGGDAGVPAPNAASTVRPAASRKQVTADSSGEIPAQRQPDLNENNRSEQQPLPGMEITAEVADSWSFEAEAGLSELARRGGVFCADQLRELVGLPADRNRVGRVFSSAAKAGLIEEVAAVRSSSPSRRSGLVRLWRGRGAA